jgi:hypothetical protein
MNRMLEVANELTKEQFIVLMPFVSYIKPGEQENNPVKEMLDDMHFAKIELSSSIAIVWGTEHYIGQSTTRERDYAYSRNLPIRYYE